MRTVLTAPPLLLPCTTFASGKEFFCNGAWRSPLAADVAQQMGLEPVCELDGGFTAWKAAGLPVGEYGKKKS